MSHFKPVFLACSCIGGTGLVRTYVPRTHVRATLQKSNIAWSPREKHRLLVLISPVTYVHVRVRDSAHVLLPSDALGMCCESSYNCTKQAARTCGYMASTRAHAHSIPHTRTRTRTLTQYTTHTHTHTHTHSHSIPHTVHHTHIEKERAIHIHSIPHIHTHMHTQ